MGSGRIKEDTLKVFGNDYPTQYVIKLYISNSHLKQATFRICLY